VTKRYLDMEQIIKTVAKHPMSPDRCFVCATALNRKNKTREDAIPRWVQRRFGLMNQHLRLVNLSHIEYRHLKVPCCRSCNNEHLSRLENVVQEAVTNGFDATAMMPEITLYQWLAKVYVGLLYSGLFLPFDHKKADNTPILMPECLENVRILWLWLQLSLTNKRSVRAPGSVFLFRCFVPDDKKEQFDLLDDFFSDCIAIRLGEVGLVADFLDTRVHWNSMWPYLRKYQEVRLHPFQFREIAVKIFYKARLLDLDVEIDVECEDDDVIEVKLIPKPIDGSNSFRKWDYAEYARMLAHYTGIPFEKLFLPDGAVWTWLYDDSGKLIDITEKCADWEERWRNNFDV
jgi:hypothetical protein